MSSKGTAADISAQEANDLLQKLITESTRVKAVFVGRGLVGAIVHGFVSRRSDDVIWVTESLPPVAADNSIRFGLRDVAMFKYGDSRAFPDAPSMPDTPALSSALLFVYPDGAQLGLFEMASEL